MKLFRHGVSGAERPGILDSEGRRRDLSDVVPDLSGEVLSDVGLQRISDTDLGDLPEVSDDVRLGPCVSGTGKFICIGLNDAAPGAESGLPLPREPVVFIKATSAICGPNDPIISPRGSVKTDW